MCSYRRVASEDRFKIKALLDAGLNQTQVADKLGFNKSTISREVSRNSGGRGYRFQQAHRLAAERQRWRCDPRKLDLKLKRQINKLLKLKWSPEQISNRLKYESQSSVSYEAIYQYVYKDYKAGGSLFLNLRFSHRQRRPRFPRKNKDRRGIIQNAVSIESRTNGANNRSRLGHWERDVMLGKDRKNSLLVAVDRKSREIRIGKMKRHTAKNTHNQTKKLLKGKTVKSITNDRGHEFTEHKKLSKDLNVPVYFCHAYSSCERGSVENRIGIIRQYLPKGKDLKYLKQKTIERIEYEINTRPMKCLDWKTPYEFISGETVALTA